MQLTRVCQGVNVPKKEFSDLSLAKSFWYFWPQKYKKKIDPKTHSAGSGPERSRTASSGHGSGKNFNRRKRPTRSIRYA